MVLIRAFTLVFITVSLFAQPPGLERKPERPRLNVSGKSPVLPKTVVVDCTKGDSIQDAIDRNAPPITVEVHGLCIENVSIAGKLVNLRGTDPLADGIQGVSTTSATVQVFDVSELVLIENLGIRDGLTHGINVTRSSAQVNNCHITGHANGSGLTVNDGLVIAEGTTVANNFRGALASDGRFFCIACDFTGNTSFAAVATRGGLLSLLDSYVTGRGGIQASFPGSYADIDCFSEDTTHPCSMQVTGTAAVGVVGGTAGLFVAGDFTGSVRADENGDAFVYGSRRILNASPGPPNQVGHFGTFWAGRAFETGEQSQLYGPMTVSRFGRLLITEATAVTGSIQCNSAGDAWLDPTVVRSPGVTVTGCEHAP